MFSFLVVWSLFGRYSSQIRPLRRRCRVGDEAGKGCVLLIGQGRVKADSVLERVKPGCFAVSPRGR